MHGCVCLMFALICICDISGKERERERKTERETDRETEKCDFGSSFTAHQN